jgi:N-formylglutamate deformylase
MFARGTKKRTRALERAILARPMTYREVTPTNTRSWVIVEVPHAGTTVPAECLAQLVVPARALGQDADLYVDQLYADAPLYGATLLTTPISRYVVDLNRAEEDIDAESVVGARAGSRAPRGVIWRLSGERDPVLAQALTRAQFSARIAQFYRPYHQRLRELIAERHAEFGRVLVIAAHSMPSVGRKGLTPDLESVRADVVPGTRGRTSADNVYIDRVDRFFHDRGLQVRHDVPYSGGFTTAHYGRPATGVHVIQVELARRLYMDETTLTPKADAFEALRGMCANLIQSLAAT